MENDIKYPLSVAKVIAPEVQKVERTAKVGRGKSKADSSGRSCKGKESDLGKCLSTCFCSLLIGLIIAVSYRLDVNPPTKIENNVTVHDFAYFGSHVLDWVILVLVLVSFAIFPGIIFFNLSSSDVDDGETDDSETGAPGEGGSEEVAEPVGETYGGGNGGGDDCCDGGDGDCCGGGCECGGGGGGCDGCVC